MELFMHMSAAIWRFRGGKHTHTKIPNKSTPRNPRLNNPRLTNPRLKSPRQKSTQEVIHMRGCKRTSHRLLSTQWTLEATCATITAGRKPPTNNKGMLPPQQSQQYLYEEFTRLAETRLAQHTIHT